MFFSSCYDIIKALLECDFRFGLVSEVSDEAHGSLMFVVIVIFCVFSSPEPKAQVSFSDQNLSVVRRLCPCRQRCRKLFTFSSSSPEPLGQFQPNLAQCILG